MKILNGLLVLALMALISGCGGSDAIDENKPVDQVAAEAAAMGQAELQQMVDKYEAAIADKAAEVDELKAKIKEIPLKELLGDEAKTLKGDLEGIVSSLGKLKDQMAVYSKELSAE